MWSIAEALKKSKVTERTLPLPQPVKAEVQLGQLQLPAVKAPVLEIDEPVPKVSAPTTFRVPAGPDTLRMVFVCPVKFPPTVAVPVPEIFIVAPLFMVMFP